MPKFYSFKRPNNELTKVRDIVVVTLPNVVDRDVRLHASVLMGSSSFNQDRVNKYFRYELHMEKYPFHFALEYAESDYHALMLEPTYTRSKYLADLVEAGVIPYRYRDAICVCIYEDYNVDHPDDRMYDVLAYRILAPVMRQFSIIKQNVKFLDDILVETRSRKASRYLVGTSKHFVNLEMMSAIVRYHV